MADLFSSHSDEELLAEIHKHDHGAFSELVERYSAKLYNMAYRMLNNKNDAEDLVQDVFLKIWNNPEMWDKKHNIKFSTYFYKVVTNKCIDSKRKNSYRKHEDLDDKHIVSNITATAIENKSKSELICKYIEELPERQQLALNLCYYEQLTTIEAAEILELTPKGVQSLLLRAKENLRNKLRLYYKKQAI